MCKTKILANTPRYFKLIYTYYDYCLIWSCLFYLIFYWILGWLLGSLLLRTALLGSAA